MISKKGWVGGITFLIALAAGCALIPKPPLENPYGTLEGAREGEIFHIPTGIRVNQAQLLDMIGGSRIIYIGETHDNVRAHQIQLEIIKGLAERFPGQVAVGMEMFGRPSQEAMDRWSRGELSERGFLRESQWYTNWRMDYRYYKPILDYIRERHIALLALNASSELKEELRNHGLDGLSEAWQNRLPDMDLSDPHHRKLTEAFYNAHPHTSPNSFETFYQIQVLWDETMAETVAKYLATEEGRDKKVVVLAGGTHVRYGFGIPRRVFRRLPVAYSIVLPVEVSTPEDKKDRLMDVSLPEIPLVPADFFWMITYEDLKREKVRLGVMFEEAEGDLKVIKVLDESLADRKRPGEKGKLIIRRDDEPLEITVHFQASQ
jgi:uncharacterized iron-regulated protein